MSGGTKLSVVVVSFSESRILERCLHALVSQCNTPDTHVSETQLIVVKAKRAGATFASDAPDLPDLTESFPSVTFLEASPNATVPQMRKRGIEKSIGEIVALLEDDCIVAKSWRQSLVAAHEAGHAAVGGAVEPGDFEKPLDWAVFFCEYARFMQPFAGKVPYLAGNNLSYNRETLRKLDSEDALRDGFYEVFANSALELMGEQLYATPDASVRNIHSWALDNATSVPFHHGRGFAAMRFAKGELSKRLSYSAATFVLPGLQTLRVMRQVLARNRYHDELLQALPYIMLFWTCWSIGEFVGYLLGPGTSLEQWR